jgi:hypothetical protein
MKWRPQRDSNPCDNCRGKGPRSRGIGNTKDGCGSGPFTRSRLAAAVRSGAAQLEMLSRADRVPEGSTPRRAPASCKSTFSPPGLSSSGHGFRSRSGRVSRGRGAGREALSTPTPQRPRTARHGRGVAGAGGDSATRDSPVDAPAVQGRRRRIVAQVRDIGARRPASAQKKLLVSADLGVVCARTSLLLRPT